MKLYFHPMSSNARRARMAAVALGLRPELSLIDLQKGDQKRPEYLALNPNGKVPTLVDGDVVLWESIEIMMYLADATPGQRLYPTERIARAHTNKWLIWTAAHWSPTVGTLVFERMLKRMFGLGEADEYTVKRFGTLLTDNLKVLDGQLAKTRHVAGDEVSLADLAIAAPLMYTPAANLPVADHPHVARWFGELKQHEAWLATEPGAKA